MFLLAFSWLFWVCFCRSFLSIVFTGYVILFSICCKTGLVLLNSLNFCLSLKLLISLSILNGIFARYSNCGCRFFSFSTLSISCHFLLACRVSAGRPTVNCIGFPLYVICCFSLAAYNILSLCLALCLSLCLLA